MDRINRMEDRLRSITRRMVPKGYVSCSLVGTYDLGKVDVKFTYVMNGIDTVRNLSDLEIDNHLSSGEIEELSMEIGILVSKILSVHTEGKKPRVGSLLLRVGPVKSSTFQYDFSD